MNENNNRKNQNGFLDLVLSICAAFNISFVLIYVYMLLK